MLSFLVYAQAPSLKQQIYGETHFVSGGIGGDERDELQLMRADYNLHLLFSLQPSGAYLSDIAVVITDAGGNEQLKTVTEGPLLFVRLKPGRYSISANMDGHLHHKTIKISDQGDVSLSFTWPQ